MAKRFFYAAAGTFLLVVTYHIGAERARAEWVPGAEGNLIGILPGLFIDAAGLAYETSAGFARHPAGDLPVPVADVKLLDESFLVSRTDEVWVWTPLHGGWNLVGQFSGSTAASRESFGRAKAAFR